MKTSGHESTVPPLGDKTIMESIYRLVRTKKMVLAMQLVISIAFLGGINDSHE
jgi:hypothetical protein